MAESFQVLRLWRKYVETRVITEEGSFVKDHLPEDYAGAELEVEIIQRAIFSDSSGHLMELRFDDLSDLQDENREKGVGAEIKDSSGQVLLTLPATSPVVRLTEWREVTNGASMHVDSTVGAAIAVKAGLTHELASQFVVGQQLFGREVTKIVE